MEWKPDQKKTVTRLLLCAGAAAALLGAADRVTVLEPYRPWLEEHKLEAGAALAGVLFGLSLLVLPLGPEDQQGEDTDPCEGYVPVE